MKPLKILPTVSPTPSPSCGTTAVPYDPMTVDLNTLPGSALVKLRGELEMALTRAHDARDFEAVARLRARRDAIQELLVELEW